MVTETVSPESRNVLVVCPTCKKSAQVPVPTYIFEKNRKSGIVKVQIHTGIVCDHQFVVYVDQNYMARGFEAIDFLLEIAPPPKEVIETPKEVAEVDLRDVVAKFGSFATLHMIRAFIFNLSVIVVKSPTDSPTLEQTLNELFMSLLPDIFEPIPLIEAIERKNFTKLKIDEDKQVVLDTNGIVLNSPWGMKNKKAMTWEESLLKRGTAGDEREEYSKAIKKNLMEFYKRAEFTADLLQKEKRIFIKDLQKVLQKEFGMKHNNYQVELLESMIKRRFKGGKKLIKKIRRWQDNLAEILGGGDQ